MQISIETLINSDINPLESAQMWVAEAKAAGIADYNAMSLATVDKNGLPNLRMVLLKGLDLKGFVFYTNMNSTKGAEILENPYAAINFYWPNFDGEYGRCLRARGKLEKVSEAESDAYFQSRRRGSRFASIASDQSAPLLSREELLKKTAQLEADFGADDETGQFVPRPNHWYGHRLLPSYIEFWADGEFRMHDRVAFTRETLDSAWHKHRLNP